MQDLNDMLYFAEVVDRGGFAAAGRALGVPKSKLSRRVAELEERLGVRLLQRTTRKLSLTDEGAAFHVRCKELLAGVDEAESEITAHAGQVVGQLRLNVPVSFGVLHLAPLWAEFMRQHPKVTLEVILADRLALFIEFLFYVRVARQEVNGVCDSGGGGVVGRKHEEDSLVGDLFVAEVFAVLVFFAAEVAQHVEAIPGAAHIHQATKIALQGGFCLQAFVHGEARQVEGEDVHDAVDAIEEVLV